jgi:ABC-type transport system involved in multi-copper enzyme maturation permease subunit
VILAAFTSEWTKLRRRSLLLVTYLALAALAALFTVLTFARAGQARRRGGEFISLARLAQPDGLAQGLVRATLLLGVVALSVVAAQMAGEYSLGTLRNLLVRQPRRPHLLGGKLLALISFALGAMLAATVAAVVAAVVMAHVRGVSTAAWTSSSGWHLSGQAVGDGALAIVGYACIGLVLGVLVRSPVAAVVVGIVYLLPVENILAAVVSSTQRWLPGQLLDAIARGGNSTASFSSALVTMTLYVVGALVVAFAVFARRDVTA